MDIKNIEIFLGIVILTSNIYLGLMVYLKNPQSWTNRFFSFLALNISIYTVVHFLSLNPPLPTPENQLFWIRIDMFVGAFIGPILFLLVYTFPRKEFTLPKKYFIPLLGLMSITAIASLTPFIFRSIHYPGGEPMPIPGRGIFIYFFDFIGLIFTSFVVLILKYRKATGLRRIRHFYFLLGVLVTFSTMGITTLIFVVVLKTSAFVFLGPLSTAILIIFIAYAIIKHRFLDIQPIIARATSFLVLLVIVATVYVLILLVGLQRFLGIEINVVVFLSVLLVTLVAIFTFQPIETTIRRFTDRIFFKGRYDSDKVLSKLAHIITGTLSLDYMTRQILSTLTKEMRITKAVFLVFDKHKIIALRGVGYEDCIFKSSRLESLFHLHTTSDHHFIFEELEDKAMKELFRKLDIAVAIPIRVKTHEIALLILGSKSCGEPYNKKDLDLLDIFSSQAGIAIQNSKLYEEVKKHSKKLEEKVVGRTKELQRLYDAQSKFIADISHQLQTPLAITKGNIELICQECKDNGQSKISGVVNKTLDRMSRLVRDLLVLAKAEFGQQKLNIKIVSLNNLIGEIYEQSQILAKDKNINFLLNEKSDMDVSGDAEKLRELFLNLISNAIKYTDAGGEIKLALEKNSKWAKIEISDTGRGIPKKDLPHIFDRFYRVSGEKFSKSGGTGLGLAICKWIAEAHHGKIFVKSKLGKGSMFTVRLPIA